MKKLALALVCLFSLAFFASCTQEGNPTIQVLNEEGYVQNGDIVNLGDEVNFGFVMSSAIETGSPLASLVIKIDDNDPDTITLTGTSFSYKGTLIYGLEKEIVGESTIIATVYDARGAFATTSLTFQLNQDAQPLIGKTVEWIRKGANLIGDTETEMAGYGLQWTGSYKEVFATLKPVDGAKMFVCNGDDFATITTDAEKVAYFINLVETGEEVDSYRKITTNHSDDYNDMLAIVNGEETWVVLISHAEIETGSFGTQITIKGEAK